MELLINICNNKKKISKFIDIHNFFYKTGFDFVLPFGSDFLKQLAASTKFVAASCLPPIFEW